jgi:BolA protein
MKRADVITEKLTSAFSPSHLAILNESDQHKGPPGRETHFRVVVVSDQFSGKSPVARHKLIYGALGEELAKGLHALAITAKTPHEWEAAPEPGVSPLCASAKTP